MSKIILIGGPPRGCKTTLAQSISKEKGIPWISTDILDDIAQRYTSDEERQSLFPKTALRRKSGGGNDEMYETFSVEEIVSAYRKQAEGLHTAIEIFIEYSLREGWDYIIEGYHITPKFSSSLKEKQIEVSSLVLINTKPEEAINRSRESIVKNDWLRDKTKKEKTYSKISEMIGLYSNELKEEAKEFNVDVVDMGGDFHTKFDKAYNLLTK